MEAFTVDHLVPTVLYEIKPSTLSTFVVAGLFCFIKEHEPPNTPLIPFLKRFPLDFNIFTVIHTGIVIFILITNGFY